jgi:hypothetical protein|tara:strand:+ start:4043 stop:4780 length:738 start_codon:yes stop_codon:yes gene_type:complete
MKDILKDIVDHTQNLGFLTTVKVSGEESETTMFSMADDRSVIMEAKTHNPYPDMLGTFGMPQLQKLKYLLDGSEYKTDAKISVTTGVRNEQTIPTGIKFENATGDFKNDYKFMLMEIINEKMKTVKFRGVKWDVEVVPSLAGVQRFNFQAGANSEHPTFLAKTEDGNLKFIFGDAGSHGGEFVFATDTIGTLDRGWTWPVASILAILKIADVNNTKMSLSNEGAIQIELDSGLATYKYIIPAQAA